MPRLCIPPIRPPDKTTAGRAEDQSRRMERLGAVGVWGRVGGCLAGVSRLFSGMWWREDLIGSEFVEIYSEKSLGSRSIRDRTGLAARERVHLCHCPQHDGIDGCLLS